MLILAIPVAKFTAVDVTDGKFATGVVDNVDNLSSVSLAPLANLPPVLLIPVVHHDLRISL